MGLRLDHLRREELGSADSPEHFPVVVALGPDHGEFDVVGDAEVVEDVAAGEGAVVGLEDFACGGWGRGNDDGLRAELEGEEVAVGLS